MHGQKSREGTKPPPLPAYLSEHPDGALLAVKLQPRASANEVCGPLGNELRVRVTAAPVDFAANEALLRLLAEKLDWPRSKMEMARGMTARHKTVKFHSISAAEVLRRLTPWLKTPAKPTVSS